MFLQIPIELKQRWNQISSKEVFLRDYCNVRVGSISPFIRRKSCIDEMFDYKRSNPYNDHIPLTFREDFKCTNRNKIRFMHIDLAKSQNSIGMSCCYVDKFVIVSTGNVGIVTKPFIVFDFVAKITAEHGADLILPDIEAMIYELSKKGFIIALTTFDRFQSLHMMQNLNRSGFVSTNISMDRTTSAIVLKSIEQGEQRKEPFIRVSTHGQYNAAWQSLQDVIYERRISMPYYSPIVEDLKNAEYDSKHMKVIGLKNASLDTLESMAGSVFNATNNSVYIDPRYFDTMSETQDSFYAEGSAYQTDMTVKNRKEKRTDNLDKDIFIRDDFYSEYGL
jgi:hypothetical protein